MYISGRNVWEKYGLKYKEIADACAKNKIKAYYFENTKHIINYLQCDIVLKNESLNLVIDINNVIGELHGNFYSLSDILINEKTVSEFLIDIQTLLKSYKNVQYTEEKRNYNINHAVFRYDNNKIETCETEVVNNKNFYIFHTSLSCKIYFVIKYKDIANQKSIELLARLILNGQTKICPINVSIRYEGEMFNKKLNINIDGLTTDKHLYRFYNYIDIPNAKSIAKKLLSWQLSKKTDIDIYKMQKYYDYISVNELDFLYNNKKLDITKSDFFIFDYEFCKNYLPLSYISENEFENWFNAKISNFYYEEDEIKNLFNFLSIRDLIYHSIDAPAVFLIKIYKKFLDISSLNKKEKEAIIYYIGTLEGKKGDEIVKPVNNQRLSDRVSKSFNIVNKIAEQNRLPYVHLPQIKGHSYADKVKSFKFKEKLITSYKNIKKYYE